MRHNLVMSESLWKDLKVFIMNKQGDLKKGDLSRYVSVAISNLIQGDNYTQTLNTQLSNRFGFTKGELRVKKLMEDICEYHLKNYGIRLERKGTIHRKELSEAIAGIMNYHDVHGRALQTRMKELLECKYLSNNGPNPNLFTVLKNGSDDEEFQQREDEQNKKQQQEQELMKQREQEADSIMEA